MADVRKLTVQTKGGSAASMREALADVGKQVDGGRVKALVLVAVTDDGIVHIRREWDTADPLSWVALRGASAIAASQGVDEDFG